jgi:hypothetical protein
MKQTYSWSRSYGVEAQVFGEIYYNLPERTPEKLLAAAKEKKSPIHSLFNWDDKTAAHEYRLVQARCMVNSLNVEIVSIEGKNDRVQAFIHSSDRGSHVAVFEASNQELDDAEQKCIREMNTFKHRWKSLQLARNVISAINEANQQTSRRRKKAA